MSSDNEEEDLQDRGSLDKDPVRSASSPSPGENFSARNREEWIAIRDQREQEGRGLQGMLRSFDTNDPHGHETVHCTFSTFNPATLEAANAKKRRLGNDARNLFGGLPDLLEARRRSQQASSLPGPRQTDGEPPSRQKQPALPPVDPRKTTGEPSGRAGSGSGGGDGVERQVKGKGKQAEDVDTGFSALPFRPSMIGTHYRERAGVLVDISPEELGRLSDEEADEEDDEVVGEN